MPQGDEFDLDDLLGDIAVIDQSGKTKTLKDLAVEPPKATVVSGAPSAVIRPPGVAASAPAPVAAPLLNGMAEKTVKKDTTVEPTSPGVEGALAAVVAPEPAEERPGGVEVKVKAPEPPGGGGSPLGAVPTPPAAPKVEPPPAKAVPSPQQVMADGALKSAGLALNDDDLRRYHNAADLFFRDLRDAIETKSKFTMPSVSGGLGLTDEQADKLMAELTRLAANQRAALKEKVVEEKRRFVSGNVEKMMGEEERRESAESESLDRMYGQIAAKVAASTKKTPTAAQPPKPSAPPEPKFIPVVSMDEKKKPAPPTTAPAPSSPPAPVSPPPAPGSQIPTPAAFKPAEPKPTMSDIKFTPKLIGPVEELKAMAVKDFRRLSRDPHEATLKIKDKIDLLAEQSFEAKIAGVKAWQESDANRLYLDMLRKSLEGKPILDIISERENANEPVLSKAEFDAIMELNRKLRFG